MQILAEISPGELFDKITILEIKAKKISEGRKRTNVEKELRILTEIRHRNIDISIELAPLIEELKTVNEKLWTIEDDIRDCERRKDFDQAFVELARSVYLSNDRRAGIKKKINELLNSNLFEEKSYQAYSS
ncbi:MAG: DUF6165 family protein [Nitrospiria bacterium]